MGSKVAAIFKLFKAGEEVSNAAAWSNATAIANLLIALLAVGAAWGFRVDLDSNTVQALAAGVVALLTAFNAVVHTVTDHRVGVPVHSDAATNAPAGGDAGTQVKPEPDIRDPGGA